MTRRLQLETDALRPEQKAALDRIRAWVASPEFQAEANRVRKLVEAEIPPKPRPR